MSLLPKRHSRDTALGVAVRAHRAEDTVAATAGTIGVSGATVKRVERGLRHPNPKTAGALAQWLGWSVEQVVVGAGTRPGHPPSHPTPRPRTPQSATVLGVEVGRRRGGLAVQQLADALGLSSVALALFESGKLQPSTQSAGILATWLGWTEDAVVTASTTLAST